MVIRSFVGQENGRLASLLLLFILSLALLLAVACSDDDETPPEGLTTLELRNNKGEEQRLLIEIADTDQERGVGLSNRTELGEDRGMLFIIPSRGLGFWMKDTLIPLSVAFIGPCGEIVHIADMQPQTETLHNTDREYKYGLEANLGWFAEHGIGVGSTVEIPQEFRQPDCA